MPKIKKPWVSWEEFEQIAGGNWTPSPHTHLKAEITDTPWSWTDVLKAGSNLTDLATRQHAGLTDILADQHHPQSHTLASHSTKPHSALTDVTHSQHHNKTHSLVGVTHTATGLTIGWVIKATGATTFAWGQLLHSHLGSVGTDDHHAQDHASEHEVGGGDLLAFADITGFGTYLDQAVKEASNVIHASLLLNNTGLHVKDTNASHYLIIKPGSDITANRTLSLVTGDAARTITLQGNPTLADWFDQAVKQASHVHHASITVGNTGLHILDTNASHDLIIKPGSDLSADRILTLTTGNTARTITLNGNPTLADWFDQGVKQANSPQFAGLTLTGAADLVSFDDEATKLGKTSNVPLDTVTDTPAEWAALPIGYSRMFSNSVGIAGGAPLDSYGYFNKVANRDAEGGWAGLWVGHGAGQNYMGRTNTSASFATWDKLWSDANDGPGSGLDADLWDTHHLPALVAERVLTTLDGVNLSWWQANFGWLSDVTLGSLEEGETIRYDQGTAKWIDAWGIDYDNPRLVYKFYTDFFSIADDTNDPWIGAAIGVGGKTAMAGTSNHPGIIRFISSETQGHGYRFMTAVNCVLIAGAEHSEFCFKTPEDLSNVRVRLGFQDSLTSTAPTDGVYIDISGTTLTGKTRNNGAESTTGTSWTLVVDTWYRAKIAVNNDASEVIFILYSEAGTQLWSATLSTNIPTATGRETGHGVVAWVGANVGRALIILDMMIATRAGYIVR